MVITRVPVRIWIRVGQQRVNQDAKAFGVGIQIAQLRHRVDHAAAAGAARQPDDDVESHFRLAILLQQLDLRLHLFAVFIGLAGEQKAP